MRLEWGRRRRCVVGVVRGLGGFMAAICGDFEMLRLAASVLR